MRNVIGTVAKTCVAILPGFCLQQYMTAVGDSLIRIIVGMSEGNSARISLRNYMLYGMPMMVMTVIISTVYVWLRYYVLKI